MIQKETRFHVACDNCGNAHRPDPEADSALGARISAGIAGWRYQAPAPGARRSPDRKGSDTCKACVEAGA